MLKLKMTLLEGKQRLLIMKRLTENPNMWKQKYGMHGDAEKTPPQTIFPVPTFPSPMS